MPLMLLAGLWALVLGRLTLSDRLRLEGRAARLYGAILVAVAGGLLLLSPILTRLLPAPLLANDAVRIGLNAVLSLLVIVGLALPFRAGGALARSTGPVWLPWALTAGAFLLVGGWMFVGSRLAGGASEPMHHGKSLSYWLKGLGNDDVSYRIGSQLALEAIGAAALPGVSETLRTGTASAKYDAALVLGSLGGKEALTGLLAALPEPDTDVREAVATGLGRAAAKPDSDTGRIVQGLLQTLRDKEPSVRWNAAEALAGVGPRAVSAKPELLAALEDANDLVRLRAAIALGKIDPKAPEAAVRVLIATLEKEGLLASDAAMALGALGPRAAAAVPTLIKALRSSDKDVRRWAADALGKLGPAATPAVPGLIEVLRKDAEPDARRNAAQALGELGSAAGPVAAALKAAARDKDEGVRDAAAQALAKLGGG